MAPNSSSVFNEAPTEAKPPSSSSEMTSSSDARPVATTTTSPAIVATSTECSAKQAVPQMEPTIDETESSSTEGCEAGSSLRFARVSPVGLEDAKKTMTFRKSCLKRSSSFLPCPLNAIPVESAVAEKAELAQNDQAPKKPDAPIQKNRRRCWECKAKVGLTALTCRCDYTFCSKHRYAEEHNCRFNFKGAAKRKLEDENPRVVPSKVARIN